MHTRKKTEEHRFQDHHANLDPKMAHLYNHTKTQQKLQQARKSQLSRPQAQGHNYNLTQAADAGRTHTHRVRPERRETAFTCKKTPE